MSQKPCTRCAVRLRAIGHRLCTVCSASAAAAARDRGAVAPLSGRRSESLAPVHYVGTGRALGLDVVTFRVAA